MDFKKSFQNIRLITTVSSFNLTNILKEFSQKLTKAKRKKSDNIETLHRTLL